MSNGTPAPWPDARILVTGGAGFIGSHLCRRLLSERARVVVADRDTSLRGRSLLTTMGAGERSRLELIELDLRNQVEVERLLAGHAFDYVFHLAGYSVIERSTEFPYDSLITNVLGMLHVLEAARKFTGPERIVITSTDKVYGEMEGASYLEDSPLRGIGLYDAGKLAADVIARSYYHSFGTPISVVRLCNVFGPHDYNTGYRLFPKSLSRIFGPEAPVPPLLYYASITHSRDYVYIDDVVDALLHAAVQPAARGEVFNMASAAHRSTPKILKEIVDMSVHVLAAVDPDRAELVEKNGILITTSQQGPVAIQRQHLDASKMSRVLGFDIRVSYERALKLTVEHYAEQRYGRTG